MEIDMSEGAWFRDVALIVRLALAIEGRRAEVWRWYRHTPVEPFARRTAEQMVRAGEAAAVVAFLERAVADEVGEVVGREARAERPGANLSWRGRCK